MSIAKDRETTSEFCCCWQNIFSRQLCRDCQQKISYSFYPRSVFFEQEGLRILAMSRYTKAMKNFIYQCKANPFNSLYLPQRSLLKELSAYWAEELKLFDLDGIVVVPGHPLRSKWQSDLAWCLGMEVIEQLKFKGIEPLLKRKLFVENKFYRMQKNATRRERLEAVGKQFFISTKAMPKAHEIEQNGPVPKRLLLVDDVCTTGATLRVCAEQLRQNGYEVPLVLVLSKVELDS